MKAIAKAVASVMLATGTLVVPLSVQAAAVPARPSAPATAPATTSLDGDRSPHSHGHGTREFRGDDGRREHRHHDRGDRWRHHDRGDRWRHHDHWYHCGWGRDRDRDRYLYRHYHHHSPVWGRHGDCYPYGHR
ncbi:hypothetical protein [Streptomyces heilongjiangensis]|uniref:Uncharacterized protein n=1 Tax=Streptomyces heilongjiangensis TaxID=945052 RepID=A0ABW1B8X2_9ACTN|nr:hypothetical protein [Streptomyces heilongjiangensis]MDC2951589.1 hypothetical protein [Streptomyces heilongjiangensis]